MDKLKCIEHAKALKIILKNENTLKRKEQVMRIAMATREYREIWKDVFYDMPEIIEEMDMNLKKTSNPRMLID
jgi:hypothetical protein